MPRNDINRIREKIRLRPLDRQTTVGVVGRFASTGCYLIITVYEVSELEG